MRYNAGNQFSPVLCLQHAAKTGLSSGHPIIVAPSHLVTVISQRVVRSKDVLGESGNVAVALAYAETQA